MVFLGSREDVAHLGYVPGQCPKCKARGIFTVYEAKRKLTISLLAAVPMGQQKVLECRACGARFALSRDLEDDLMRQLISTEHLADYLSGQGARLAPGPGGPGVAARRTLYQVLQVDPYAEPEVVEAAFKRLAMKYHPDRYKAPDAHDRMREILAAKDVLGDPTRRRAYDASIGIVHTPKPPEALRPEDV